jgi:hypothetical protein
MKIYLKQRQDLSTWLAKVPSLPKYYLRSKQQWEMYSPEGIFHIDRQQVYKLEVSHEKQETIETSNHLPLLIDYSIITRELVYQLPPDHISQWIHYDFYQCSHSIPNLTFILKFLENKGSRVLIDFYFEVDDNNIDPKNSWFLGEIHSFLSKIYE